MSSCDNSNIRKNYIVTSTEIDILSACTGFYTNNIYPCESDTINIQSDIVSANTLNSSVYLSGGTNLIDIFTSFNTYVTGITYDNSNNLTLERNDNVTLSTNISVFSGLTINGILSACTGIYTSNLYGCSPITVNDDLILTSGLTLNTIINDDALTQILVRDNVTGRIKYRSVSSITPDTNTYVTGTTFSSNEAILTRNDDFEVLKLSGGSNVTLSNPSLNQILIDVTIPTDTNTYVTGGTYNESTDTITLTRNDNVTIEITGVTDTFTTGGTYSNSTKLITFTRNDGNIYTVDLSSLDINDTYVTGFTYDNINTFTITRNDDVSISTSISTLSGITYYGNGIGLTNIPISGVTNLQSELDNKLNVSLFDTYTGDTQIILNTKISGATNLSAEGIFAQKNGLDLEFKGLTSTGSSLNITSNPNSVNLDVVFPTDVFVYSGNANASNSTLSFLNTTGGTFTVTNSAALFADNDINVTGGTYNPSNGCVTFTTNSGTTFDVCGFLTGITDTYVTGFTYNNANTLTITRNDGTNISTSIDIVTGLTVNGNIEMGNTSTRQIYSTGVSDISSIEYATSGTSIQMRWDGGGNSSVLSINNTDFATLSSNKTAFGGLTYGSDYSPYYTDRSLIDLGFFNSNNRYVTGGTYNNSTALITYSGANGFTPFSVDLSSLDLNDTFVTGATYNNANTFTYTNNSGGTFDVSFNVVSGLTSTGSISATTYYGDGSNLTGIVASWDGLEIITVGEDVTDGDLLYLSSGSTYLKASNTSEGTSSTELRIAVENILSGQTGNGLIQGKYTTTGLTAGDQYWVGASNGTYTNIQPSGNGDIVRYVGTALNSTILEFKPDETWIEISSASIPSTTPQPAIKNVTTSYNLLSTDFTINVSTTGDTTQTLPLSVSLTGKIYNIKNSDSTGTSTITIATTSGELIDNLYGGGNDLQTIFPQSIKLQSTGSGWIII